MKGEFGKVMVSVVLYAALGLCAARAADPQVAREYVVQATLDVDATGQVAGVGLPAEVPSMLVAPARETISHWRFKPPVREGQAVTARTYAWVTLRLVQQPDNNYGLRVVYDSNGPRLNYLHPPAYPLAEARRRAEGTLVMEAIVQPDGSLSDIRQVSSRFNHGNTGDFRLSVETALKHCRAEPEWVDGKPVATHVRLPFNFTLRSIPYSEVLSRMAAARAKPKPDDEASTTPIGQAVALDSPVQPLMGNPRS